jgi:hypothetical protein
MPIAYPNPNSIGYSAFGQSTPKVISVTDTSTELLAANDNRLYAQINNIGTMPIWVQLGIAASVGRGRRVLPGASLSFTSNELYLGVINAVTSSGGTVNTEVIEGV